MSCFQNSKIFRLASDVYLNALIMPWKSPSLNWKVSKLEIIQGLLLGISISVDPFSSLINLFLYTLAENNWNLKVYLINILQFWYFYAPHWSIVIYQFTWLFPFSPIPLVRSHWSFSRCGALGICLWDWQVEVGGFHGLY